MMNYTIKNTGGKNPVPVVAMEQEEYALAGEFLLAEARSFGKQIIAAMNETSLTPKKSGSFSGNAFSLEIYPETTKIINDITGQECTVPTGDFRRLTAEYVAACKDSKPRRDNHSK